MERLGMTACVVGLLASGTAHAGVVINELFPDPDLVDSGYEWIELVNTDAAPVDLTGWLIERSTSGAFFVKYTFPAFILDPGSHVVVGEEFVAAADYNLAAGVYFSFGNAMASGDAVHLCNNFGGIEDTLVYGPNNTDNFLDDAGAIALPAPGPMVEESVARMPDGADTDDSSLDFTVDATPTPGLDNATLPPPEIFAAAPGIAGQINTWDLTGAPAGAQVLWLWGTALGVAPLPNGICPGLELGLTNAKKLGSTVADPLGFAQVAVNIPVNASGKTMQVQAVLQATCAVSDVAETAFP